MDIIGTIKKTPLRKIITKSTVSREKAALNLIQVSNHPYREILIQLAGNQRYILNGRIYDLKPGIAGLVDYFLPHTPFYTDGDQNLLQLWTAFQKFSTCGSLIKVYSAGKYDIIKRIEFPVELKNLIMLRWDLLNRQSCISPQMVMDFMKMPIELLLDEFFLRVNHIMIPPKREQLSDFLKEHIRACCGRNCSIAELQKISGCSASHLHHTFRKETNETIRTFIDRTRLDYARSALNNGCKQKEIADLLGFSSPAAFGNWFRKHQQLLQADTQNITQEEKG